MTLLERVFNHPDLRDAPPVLVDVGASGEPHPGWRRIARYSIGVGFEPDGRSAEFTRANERRFRRWISCEKLVTADESASSTELYLTESPYCSSTLPPDGAALEEWAFSRLFAVKGKQKVGATTLARALSDSGLAGADWLKCDTQGTDLRIWQSLPKPMRDRNLAVEFEPGLIDAYVGEDKCHHMLAAMEREPFWLATLEVHGTPRARMSMLERRLGARSASYFRKYGPTAPAFVNAFYLRRVNGNDALNLRSLLLLWVFAGEVGQWAFACSVAEAGAERFNDALCRELADEAARQMRRALAGTWPRWPRLLWQKIVGHG